MVEFKDVLLVDDGGVTVGAPFVEGARVVAEVLEHGRDKKVFVFKYKNKTRYRRRHGHRQAFTRLAVRQILTQGADKAGTEEVKPVRAQRKRAAPKAKGAKAQVETGTATEVGEATTEPAEVAAKPRRASRTRRPAAQAADAKPAGRARAKKKAKSTE